jgi:hypothetical protein
MKNEFVPYDIALAMKELGFDEPCFGFYNDMDNNTPMGGNYPCDGLNSAPLYQQAFEKYDIVSWVSKDKHGFSYDFFNKDWTQMMQDSYKEAQDACLRKLIEIVKDEKET